MVVYVSQITFSPKWKSLKSSELKIRSNFEGGGGGGEM